MKTMSWVAVLTMALLLAGTAMAAETAAPADKQEACKLLGNCADEAITAALAMREQCAKMTTAANDLLAKGTQIKTRGQMWADADMTAEGDAMIVRGKAMLEQAKTMDEQCKLIIDAAKKSKDKAGKMTKTDEPPSNDKGDMRKYR